MDSFADQVESNVDVVYVELRPEQTKEHCCGNIAFFNNSVAETNLLCSKQKNSKTF